MSALPHGPQPEWPAPELVTRTRAGDGESRERPGERRAHAGADGPAGRRPGRPRGVLPGGGRTARCPRPGLPRGLLARRACGAARQRPVSRTRLAGARRADGLRLSARRGDRPGAVRPAAGRSRDRHRHARDRRRAGRGAVGHGRPGLALLRGVAGVARRPRLHPDRGAVGRPRARRGPGVAPPGTWPRDAAPDRRDDRRQALPVAAARVARDRARHALRRPHGARRRRRDRRALAGRLSRRARVPPAALEADGARGRVRVHAALARALARRRLARRRGVCDRGGRGRDRRRRRDPRPGRRRSPHAGADAARRPAALADRLASLPGGAAPADGAREPPSQPDLADPVRPLARRRRHLDGAQLHPDHREPGRDVLVAALVVRAPGRRGERRVPGGSPPLRPPDPRGSGSTRRSGRTRPAACARRPRRSSAVAS